MSRRKRNDYFWSAVAVVSVLVLIGVVKVVVWLVGG